MRDFWNQIGLYVAGNRAFYKGYLQLRGTRYLFPTAKTAVVVEGFPRTANTYAWYLAKELVLERKIAHHVHHVASLKAAMVFRVPLVVIYRSPLDAVVSLAQQRTVSPDDGWRMNSYLRRWCKFYEYSLEMRGAISFFSFHELTNEPARFVQIVGRTVGKELAIGEAAEVAAAAEEKLQAKEATKRVTGSSLPQPKREQEKERFRRTASNSPLFAHAMNVFSLLEMRSNGSASGVESDSD